MVITRIVIALLFILFAAFQINDPDPWLWIALYAFVACMATLGHFNIKTKIFLLIGMVICLVWMGFLLPDFIKWIKMGMPSIVETMKAEKSQIELVREFLGLFLSIVALYMLYRFDARSNFKKIA